MASVEDLKFDFVSNTATKLLLERFDDKAWLDAHLEDIGGTIQDAKQRAINDLISNVQQYEKVYKYEQEEMAIVMKEQDEIAELQRQLQQLEQEERDLDAQLQSQQNDRPDVDTAPVTMPAILSAKSSSSSSSGTASSAAIQQLAQIESMLELENNSGNALVEGLKSLLGLEKVAVADESGCLSISVTLNGFTGTVTLGSDKKVSDIQITSNSSFSSENLRSSILSRCKMLDSPQDLRYAILALQSGPQSATQFQSHIKELRSLCLVSTTAGSMEVTLTLRTGASIRIQADVCYPHWPGGVTIVELMDGLCTRRTADQVEFIKQAANARSFSSILDMYKFLQSNLA